MPEQELTTEERLEDLENFKRSVEDKLGILGQLDFPTNPQTKKAIEEATDSYLKDKIFDLNWENYFYYQSFFESLDGWNLIDTGSSSVSRLGVALQTGTTINNESSIDKEPVYQNVLSFDEESIFSSAFFVTSVSQTEGFIGIGEVNNGATGSHYGFFIDDDKLYGSCADGTTQTTLELFTISTNHPTSVDPIYFVEARFFPGEKIEFYVKVNYDSEFVLQGTISTNIPTGAMFEWLGARVKTTDTNASELRFGHMEYVQKRKRI